MNRNHSALPILPAANAVAGEIAVPAIANLAHKLSLHIFGDASTNLTVPERLVCALVCKMDGGKVNLVGCELPQLAEAV